MKAICYIYDTFKERGMLAFEKRIEKLFEEHKIVTSKDVICSNAWMQKGFGNGNYYNVAEIIIDNESYLIKQQTNDSMAYDDWFGPSGKQKRDLFEAILNNETQQLKEIINSLNEEENGN